MDVRKVVIPVLSAVIPFGMIVSYNISIMSGALFFLEHEFVLTLLQKQHLVSLIILGALFGALFAGPISDRYGRKKGWFLAFFCYLLGGVVSLCPPSIHYLIASRFVIGLGIGLSSVIIPIYLAEIAPSRHRGAIVSIFQLFITVGILASYMANYVFKGSENWRGALGVGLILAILGGVALFFIPESTPEKKLEKSPPFKGYIGLFIIAILLSLFQQITGINTVIYYAPHILKESGLGSLSMSLFATVGIGIANVIATLIGLKYIDRVGRKPLMMGGLLGMIIALLFLTFYLESPWIALFSIASYVVSFAVSLGLVVWVVISEIFPHQYRARGVSFALFTSWVANYAISFAFLDLVDRVGMKVLFGVFCIISAVALVFVSICLRETKGRSIGSAYSD